MGTTAELLHLPGDGSLIENCILDKNCRCSRQIFDVARRLMRENPELFRKEITADRESEQEAKAYGNETLILTRVFGRKNLSVS